MTRGSKWQRANFNPRAPYGARLWRRKRERYTSAFQSTRPIRGATGEPCTREVTLSHFNPRAPYGARHRHLVGLDLRHAISIHAPHTGRDPAELQSLVSQQISIHAPHTGRDFRWSYLFRVSLLFQSTRPIRGATPLVQTNADTKIHFNPRAPYGARHLAHSGFVMSGGISIHAPHTGRDSRRNKQGISSWISIHAPHTGRDHKSKDHQDNRYEFQSTRPIRGATTAKNTNTAADQQFQSTRPIRGATGRGSGGGKGSGDFNPRAPYGARHLAHSGFVMSGGISIHAPHTGRDSRRNKQGISSWISIHAPHTGRDHKSKDHQDNRYEFQSTRPIRGATTAKNTNTAADQQFQSTRPIRGATGRGSGGGKGSGDFNPRAPYGARLWPQPIWMQSAKISIHAPHTGRDHTGTAELYDGQRISIHAPHTGRDAAKYRPYNSGVLISIHAPHTGRD